MAPEIYIVRVYRRSSHQPEQIAGLVEIPAALAAASFTDLSELVAILEAPKKHLHRLQMPGSIESLQIKLFRQENPQD